ncbi:hypothetical protein [Paenibacillus nasutitermitis]
MLKNPQLIVDIPSRPIRCRLMSDGNFDFAIEAATEGFFVPSAKLLDTLAKVDRIGVIYDWGGTEKQIVLAYGDGVLVMITGTPRIAKGGFLFMLSKTLETP